MSDPAPSVTPWMPPPIRSQDEFAYLDARDNRGITTGLVGTCTAILTFVLFFLYPKWQDGSINPILFEWTLLNIIVSLFLFGVSSMNFWFVMEALRIDRPVPGKYFWRAERSYGAGWMLLTLAPALILVTVGIYIAGVIAIALWLVVIVLFVQGWREARVRTVSLGS